MLADRAVVITLILSVTWFASLTVSAVVWLAWSGHGTEAVGALVGGPLLALLGVIAGRVGRLQKSVEGGTDATATRSTD